MQKILEVKGLDNHRRLVLPTVVGNADKPLH
jgi:hypothetical protein